MLLRSAPDRFAALTAGARIKPYPRNQIILYSGDTVSDVYVLKRGVAKMYDIDRQGNEKVLHILKAPAIIPLAAIKGLNQVSEWFYGAVTDCEAYVLSQTDAEDRISQNCTLTTDVMEYLAAEMHEVLVRLSGLSKTDVYGKLMFVLRFLAVYHTKERRGGWHQVTFPIGQQLLADMIGMTRESTAIGARKLRDMNIIRFPRAMTLEINFKNLLSSEFATP